MTGMGSEVSIDLSEELVLDDAPYEVALKSLYTSHMIPNITNKNNVFRIRYPEPRSDFFHDIILPEGTYEFDDIATYLTSNIAAFDHMDDVSNDTISGVDDSSGRRREGKKHLFGITMDKPRLRTKLYSTYIIDFTADRSLAPILGFDHIRLNPQETHFSKSPITISNVNVIRVECNIAKGAFLNGKRTHSIYDFYPKVPAGYKIVEHPIPMIYYPIALQTVNTITVCLKDQKGNKINLMDENLSVTLHIRAVE